MPIRAIQQIQLGTVTQSERQARETLRLVKEAGFDGIELNGFMIRKTPLLIRALTALSGMPAGRGGALDWPLLTAEAGLQVVGVHEDLGSIEREPDRILAEAAQYHTQYVVVTGMYRFDYTDESAMHALAKRLNASGETLKKGGVSLLYHNHNAELLRVSPERTAFDLLLCETDPACVNFEFDSYWPTEAGADALALMKRLGARMKLYHIADRGAQKNAAAFTPIVKSDARELGSGCMNLDALIEQAKAADVSAVILESHRNFAGGSPINSFQISAEFLNRHA